VGSVFFSLSGSLNNTRTENVAPYALFGDNAGDYFGNTFSLGNYTISATAYSGSGQGGSALGTLILQFSIVDSSTAKDAGSEDSSNDELGAGQVENNLIRRELDITFFPNPSDSEIQIQISNSSLQLSKIYVYDIVGRLVKKVDAGQYRIGEDLYQLDVSGLEDGIYNVTLFAKNIIDTANFKIVIKK